MPEQRVLPLFRSDLVSVGDYECRAPRSPCGREELATVHQLVFVRRGVFVKHSGPGGRREGVGDPAHAFFFNTADPYRISHPTAGGDDCTMLGFSAEVALEVASALDPSAADRPAVPFSRSCVRVSPDVLLRYQRLRRALYRANGVDRRLAVEEEALALLHIALGEGIPASHVIPAGNGRASGRHRELAEATREILAARPAHLHSLTALGHAVGASVFHLSRVFRQQVGLPIHQYLLRLRLALALERLGERTSTVGVLALDLGFASHSHFTAAFHRTFGMTPAVARRLLRDGREVTPVAGGVSPLPRGAVRTRR